MCFSLLFDSFVSIVVSLSSKCMTLTIQNYYNNTPTRKWLDWKITENTNRNTITYIKYNLYPRASTIHMNAIEQTHSGARTHRHTQNKLLAGFYLTNEQNCVKFLLDRLSFILLTNCSLDFRKKLTIDSVSTLLTFSVFCIILCVS